MMRTALERAAAALALIVCSPLLLIGMVSILIESGAPVFFRQLRAGQHGKPFRLVKLRTMRPAGTGELITRGGDPRITRTGAILRRYKIDELPQLWNVLAGQMRLIGHRPEVLRYVDSNNALWQTVLLEKPGLTDLATLMYRNEEEVLARYADSDRAYREEILPRKLALSARYQRNRTFSTDLKLLALTATFSLLPSRFSPDRIERIFSEKTA